MKKQPAYLNEELQAAARRVIECRQELAARVKEYGRNSAGASDSRARLKAAETALVDATIRLYTQAMPNGGRK